VAEPLRRRFRSALLGGATSAATVLPRGLVDASLSGLARVAAHTKYGARARSNLEQAFGSEIDAAERKRIARAVFEHSARQLGEWLRLARSGPGEVQGGVPAPNMERGKWIDSVVHIDESIAHLHEVLAGGRGAIIVTAHIGNWELLAAALRRRGMHGAVVGLTKRNDSSANWLTDMRRACGIETLAQDSPPRELLRVLQSGGILGLLPDLEVRRLDGEFLPFFGRPALTMTAPAAFARAHRAPLVPVRCVATDVAPGAGEGEYVLSVEAPLRLDTNLPRHDATLDLSTRLNALFETWIRTSPEQWAWHQDRWRTAPGEYDAVPLAERHRRKRQELESS